MPDLARLLVSISLRLTRKLLRLRNDSARRANRRRNKCGDLERFKMKCSDRPTLDSEYSCESGRRLQPEQIRNAPLAVPHSTTLRDQRGELRNSRQRFGVRQSFAAFE